MALTFKCRDCRRLYKLEAGEAAFFRNKFGRLPSRCEYCRKAKREWQQHLERIGRGRRRRHDGRISRASNQAGRVDRRRTDYAGPAQARKRVISWVQSRWSSGFEPYDGDLVTSRIKHLAGKLAAELDLAQEKARIERILELAGGEVVGVEVESLDREAVWVSFASVANGKES